MTLPKMYGELATWWPLLSAVADYEVEAAEYLGVLHAHAERPVREVLELGSGGGNNASFMKKGLELTLVDLSEDMIEVSRAVNPECTHARGDMRDVRLGRDFDAVFVHDAVAYMQTERDLRRVFETAAAHLRPGGVALFVPDYVRETFRPSTGHGGHDGDGRALRYLAWTWDPDPSDTVFTEAFAFLLREGDAVRAVQDVHTFGLFPRAVWMEGIAGAGLVAGAALSEPTGPRAGMCEMFLGTKASHS